MKVDNSTYIPWNEKRNSVRIESRDWYGVGSLWIVDIAHVPYGCSVSPLNPSPSFPSVISWGPLRFGLQSGRMVSHYESRVMCERPSFIYSPAYVRTGQKWPDDGEIDILGESRVPILYFDDGWLTLRSSEAINLQTTNQMALHTLPGCSRSPPPEQDGVDDDLDCSTAAGCIVRESTPNSFGTGFNDVGGGVWATQFDVSGI